VGKPPHRAVDAVVGVLFALDPAGMLRRRDLDHREDQPADLSFAMPGGDDQRPHLSGAMLVDATTAQKSTFRQGQMLNRVKSTVVSSGPSRSQGPRRHRCRVASLGVCHYARLCALTCEVTDREGVSLSRWSRLSRRREHYDTGSW